jgi:diguanylate cyclase (GGDEF)-like protein
MYRQLWIAIVASTLIAFTGSLIASLASARIYLQEQLTMKNADNAATLALSLSLKKPDIVEVELAVSALFDGGHYESIRVVDPAGRPMIERVAPPGGHDVPAWFARSLPIRATPGEARISSGWQQLGTITLVSHSRFAYQALWHNALQLLGALALAGLVGGYLGTLVLRRLKAPLQAVTEQARAITERRFVTIPEPSVPELRQMAGAMNAAVSRLKAMFEDEAARIESVRREANLDPLTGLSNRSHFMASLRQALDAGDAPGGTLLLARVADLARINHDLGRDATDDLLRRIGQALGTLAEQQGEGLAARLNGADFALLLPGRGHAHELADTLLRDLVDAAEAFVAERAAAFIGFSEFGADADLSALLARIDAALASAEADGVNAAREAIGAEEDALPSSAEQWSEMIVKALDRHWVRLISFPVVELSGKLSHRECPLRLMFHESGEWLPASRFLAVAERLKLTPALDTVATLLGIEELRRQPGLPGLAINISAASVGDEAFRHQLQTALAADRATANRLWLEVAENGAFRHLEAFRGFCREFKLLGCTIGIEHFGRQFSQIGLLHDVGLDYLKVHAGFVRNLEENPGNLAFLKGLCGIAHNIGLRVFAEGVGSEAELAALAKAGFDGATGPAIREKGDM